MSNTTSFKGLIFINDSLGELDWIAPYVNLCGKRDLYFFVYLNLPKKTNAEKRQIFLRYFNESRNIIYLNDKIKFPNFLAIADVYLNSILRRMSAVNFFLFKFTRFLVDLIRQLIGKLISLKIANQKYNLIFRDYNLKDSFALSAFYSKNKDSKVIIFPHSTAIQSNSKNTPKNPPKIIEADLFLENTSLSNHFSDAYKDIFVACGSPQIDSFVKNNNILFDASSNNVLFITRNCDPRFFGINYEDSGKIFEDTIIWANKNKIDIYVKHHPRDSRIKFWRSIQKRYQNVYEVETSLNDFEIPLRFAFCFYTSACLLMSARRVPVFDVSPYSGDPNTLPFHYIGNNNRIIHELIEHEMCDQLNDITEFFDHNDESFLNERSRSQFEALVKNFPIDTIEIINASLEKLLVQDIKDHYIY